jgi:HNH endonuclease
MEFLLAYVNMLQYHTGKRRKMPTKHCNGCGLTKNLTDFATHPKASDGLQAQCRECARIRTAKWRTNHPDRAKESYKKYYLANKEACLDRGRKWHMENKERQNQKSKLYYSEHQEHLLKIAETYRNTNYEQYRIRIKEWRKNNPEKVLQYSHERRARMRGSQVEKVNFKEIFIRDKWICGICQGPIDSSLRSPHPGSKSIDHIIPLSCNGPHIKENLRASHLKCNIDRKAPIEYRKYSNIQETKVIFTIND